MALAESLLPDFDSEMAATRRLLERLPEEALGWRPHPRSYSLGELATHLAVIPRWGRSILQHDFHDLAAASVSAPAQAASRAGVLAEFDGHVADVRRLLLDRSDAELQAPWELRQRDQVLMSLPRLAALRRFLVHHLIHHRGQLTVYLRLRDVPLPPTYGPSADERM
jgi:uncharacterized damage-inducible protein DinB